MVSPVQVQVGDAVTHGSGLHAAAPVVCVTTESTQQCDYINCNPTLHSVVCHGWLLVRIVINTDARCNTKGLVATGACRRVVAGAGAGAGLV